MTGTSTGDEEPEPPVLEHALPRGMASASQAGSPPDSSLTFIGRDSALARTVGRPLLHFLHIETSGGILLLRRHGSQPSSGSTRPSETATRTSGIPPSRSW